LSRKLKTTGLSATFAAIKSSHVVRLGFRESSPPFSFLDQANRPIGYSLELCAAVVDEIGATIDAADLRIEYVKVTSDDRIPAVVDKKIDLECGSTTANFERRKQVAFSPLMFVAGTKLMVTRSSTANALADLKGKTIVVTKGNDQRAGDPGRQCKSALGLKVVTADDHEQSYKMLADGKADAFATDDILLYGLIAHHKAEAKMKVVGDFLSYDPYGIMSARANRTCPRRWSGPPQACDQSRPAAALPEMVRGAPADRRKLTSRSRRSSRRASRSSTSPARTTSLSRRGKGRHEKQSPGRTAALRRGRCGDLRRRCRTGSRR